LARKTFTTTIDELLQKDFKITCVQNNKKMNDALESFMNAYVKGELLIDSENKIVVQKESK
jgi:predicted transcriptional regulator